MNVCLGRRRLRIYLARFNQKVNVTRKSSEELGQKLPKTYESLKSGYTCSMGLRKKDTEIFIQKIEEYNRYRKEMLGNMFGILEVQPIKKKITEQMVEDIIWVRCNAIWGAYKAEGNNIGILFNFIDDFSQVPSVSQDFFKIECEFLLYNN